MVQRNPCVSSVKMISEVILVRGHRTRRAFAVLTLAVQQYLRGTAGEHRAEPAIFGSTTGFTASCATVGLVP